VFLDETPGEEFLGGIVAVLAIEALGEAVLDFIGISERRIGVKADEIGKIVDAGYIAISDFRLDGVLIPSAALVLWGRSAFKEMLQRGRMQLDGKLTGVAGDGLFAEQAAGIE